MMFLSLFKDILQLIITIITIKTIYKSTVVKEKQLGETEFPYKNCSPKLKDNTIKNRISNILLYII